MVSMFQKLAPAGGGEYVKISELRQYPAVIMDYTSIVREVIGPKGGPVHKVYGAFTCFNSEGEIVRTTAPGTELMVSVNSTKGGRKFSIIDRLPDVNSGVVLVRFFLEKEQYNAMGEVQDETLVEKIEKTYAAVQAEAPEPVGDDGPPPF